ncbi:MAG TPA: pyruvate, phosphate dikinase [Gammaproteobacteria bacterium]|nr:pyruvate, phosphate dikinase [Gammaproteobacteria bacterium]
MNPNARRFFYFGATRIDGGRDMRAQLGGKGADLAEMAALGLPVPPGFTISAQTCADFYANGKRLPADLRAGLRARITMLEKETGKRFGGEDRPLLLSVRSGAAVSMPGMMDTILNLGMNDRVVAGLARATANRRFALDAYRRLIDMFGGVVMGMAHARFENALQRIKRRHGAAQDTDLDEHGLEEVIAAYKAVYRRHAGRHFPQNPETQLTLAIAAVFRSWESPRALEYRRIHAISGLPGTAVNVQSMVFGNMGGDSGTGVAFTRDPATGRNALYGEFLVNAQGEDVVAGIRTPRPVSEIKRWRPDLHAQLLAIKDKLEQHYLDMQDIEFTIERGKLWMLQTRTGKRTGAAAVRVAVEMVREKLIDERTALLRVAPSDLNQLLLPSFDPKAKRVVLTRGLPASPGAACGRLAFSAEEAVARAGRGEQVILVRRETSPEDIHGMHVAQGILTATGGTTSHAAVVARGWGKCCIAGAPHTDIDEHRKAVTINGRRYTTRDVFSLDGATGEVMLGELPRVEPKLSAEFGTLLRWADRHRRLGVRANADTPVDTARARAFGAGGVGLCRTEHMFFNPNRISIMRQMIIAETEPARRRALRRLLPHQRRDFEEIFRAMHGLPVIIRLLDPPLHEFLPQDARAQSALARELKVSIARVRRRVAELHEANPMLGHRGCRVTITYPEVLEMQVTAITEAAIRCRRRRIAVRPQIMIPLVGIDRELATLRAQVERTIAEVRRRLKFTGRLHIGIGTMIEVPRAALTADQIAKYADFFSFGTNDLTQMTLGYSRDDVNTFLPDYLKQGILDRSPFQTIDATGVGQLVKMAVERGRMAKPDLECGICGEHGGDPASIAFFAAAGLDYVSCSPFRVPLARLAAAQSALRDH